MALGQWLGGENGTWQHPATGQNSAEQTNSVLVVRDTSNLLDCATQPLDKGCHVSEALTEAGGLARMWPFNGQRVSLLCRARGSL